MIDTRSADGPRGGPALQAGANRDFTLAGVCGVPVTASAVAINITVTESTSSGNLTIYPGDNPMPSTSTINYGAAETRANNAVVSPNAAGAITVHCAQESGTVEFIVDVTGYFQ